MIRFLIRNWTVLIPFILGYVIGKFVLAFVGPTVASLGEFQGLFTLVFPIMMGVIAVQSLTPRLKRFFRE